MSLGRHVLSFLGGEVDAHSSGVLRRDKHLQSGLAGEGLFGLLEGNAPGFRLIGDNVPDAYPLGRAGTDRVHRDPAPAELKRQGARQADDRHLRCRVRGAIRQRAFAAQGTDVDDPALPVFLHDGDDVFAAEGTSPSRSRQSNLPIPPA